LTTFTADKLPRIAPAQFLLIETSPGSFQAWLALPGTHNKEFARRVRRGAGADLTASGATRIAGSLNFKDKYAPDFPRVVIRDAQPGRKVTAAELEQLELVAPPDDFAPLSPALSASPYRWPSYADTLAGAPRNRAGNGPDRSKADFVWCMTSISWGYGIAETAARLLVESTKAREEGKSYADGTAKNAALAVEKRRPTPRAPITGHHRG
jgi:RepB DNA-primase from phage plasmid